MGGIIGVWLEVSVAYCYLVIVDMVYGSTHYPIAWICLVGVE